jgi:hypothetical protein
VAPWFYLTFLLTPARTEPVLVPFPTESACYAYQTDRLAAWMGYVKRNAWDPNYGYTSWLQLGSNDWTSIQSPRLTFRFRAGPLTVFGQCLRSGELTPKSLKALSTSPP